MDDLTLHAKNEKDLTALTETIRIFTTDIYMEFGIEKYTRQTIQRGNIKITDGLNLDIGKINAKNNNKIQVINTYPLPVITYTAGIIDCNKKGIQDLDRMIRKTMNMYGGLHQEQVFTGCAFREKKAAED